MVIFDGYNDNQRRQQCHSADRDDCIHRPSTRDSQRSPSSGNNKPLSSKSSYPHPVENIFTKLLKHSGILGAKALFNLKPGNGVAKAKVKVHLRGISRDDRLEQIHADERIDSVTPSNTRCR